VRPIPVDVPVISAYWSPKTIQVVSAGEAIFQAGNFPHPYIPALLAHFGRFTLKPKHWAFSLFVKNGHFGQNRHFCQKRQNWPESSKTGRNGKNLGDREALLSTGSLLLSPQGPGRLLTRVYHPDEVLRGY